MRLRSLLLSAILPFTCVYADEGCPKTEILGDEIQISASGADWNFRITTTTAGLNVDGRSSSSLASYGSISIASGAMTRGGFSITKVDPRENLYARCPDNSALDSSVVSNFGVYLPDSGRRVVAFVVPASGKLILAEKESQKSEWKIECSTHPLSTPETAVNALYDLEIAKGISDLNYPQSDDITGEACPFNADYYSDLPAIDPLTPYDSATCKELISKACLEPFVWRESLIFATDTPRYNQRGETADSIKSTLSKQRRILARGVKRNKSNEAIARVSNNLSSLKSSSYNTLISRIMKELSKAREVRGARQQRVIKKIVSSLK